jgi:hypothetical protein
VDGSFGGTERGLAEPVLLELMASFCAH